MAVVIFSHPCTLCDRGIIPLARPGVDWPERCGCEGKRSFTQYELASRLDEDPRAIVRVHELRAGDIVAGRVLAKLAEARLLVATPEERAAADRYLRVYGR